jgi:hypothetical protein
MRQLGKIALIILCLALCGAGAIVHLRKTAAAGVRPAELYALIYGHLQSLRVADGPRAYRPASTVVQPGRDTVLPAGACPGFSSPPDAQRIEFGSVEMRAGRALVQVFLTDHNGQVTPCVYTLVHGPDGWKIEAVSVKDRWPAGRRLGGIRA